MRTAFTIAAVGSKWVIIAGPPVNDAGEKMENGKPCDEQRHAFDSIGLHWPKDASEVHFQSNDGQRKERTKAKAEGIITGMAAVEKRLAEKAVLQKKRDEEQAASAAAEKKKREAETAAALAAEVKVKELRRNPPPAPKIEVPRK